MATAPPPPYPAAEEAPQYENGERSSSDFSLDLKDEERHVYDDDKEEEDAPKQTVPSGGILLDRLKAEKQGSTIIDTSTGRVLYSVAAVNHFSTYRGTQSTFKHGEDPATPPYASIDNIAVTLAPLPGENSSETVTNDKKFLYSHRRFLGTPKHFKVDGVEYTLKMKWWTTKMKFDLIPTDAPDSAPLATFQAGYWRDRGDILIHPCAIAHSLSSSKGKTAEGQIPQHSLLHNGMPTRLLDLALVAEAIYKVNLCQSSNAGAAAASASASAGAAAAAATAVSS